MSRARSVSQLINANSNVNVANAIIFSDSSTQTTNANNFLNPTVSATYVGNPTFTGGTNWFSYGSDYFGAEIASTHKLTNGKTYARVQGRLPYTASSGSSNPTFWVLVVSHATGTPTVNNPLTIVSGWKFRLPNGTNGDSFTFNFEDALESFGSAKIPDTGYYYIGWVHTAATGMTSGSGSWWVDYVDGGSYTSPNGTVFYKSNPGPVGPTTFNSFNGNLVAKGMHWRFYEKADYTVNNASSIKADKLESNFSIRVNKKLAGVYELVNHTSWTSNTSAVYVAFQPGLYSHYKLFWNISHGPTWSQTRLRFCDSSLNPITSNDYSGAGWWFNGGDTALTVNSTYFGHGISYIWLAGNGTTWESMGDATIFTGDDYIYNLGVARNAADAGTPGNRFPTVRGQSQLYNNGDTTAYNEGFSGSYRGSTAAAGFVIYGLGTASRLGDVWVYGARYE